jgi:flagellar FliL protein
MTEEAQAKPKGGSPPFLMIGVVVGTLALGGVAGTFLVAPRVVAGRAAAKPAAHEKESRGEQAGEDKKKIPVFRLENLIVNPADSQGTRFLMATIAFEVDDEKTGERLREREVQVRDVVMSALESQTLEMLTRPGARDSLKLRLANAVAPFTGRGKRVRVYLPQFVIQ